MDRSGSDQDKELIELLGRLKDAGPEYPPNLYAGRRATVIAALVALPLGGALAVSLFARLASTIKAMSVVDKIVLAVEVAAITGVSAYGAAAAYIYRNELKALLLGQPTAITSPVPAFSTGPALPVTEATPSETLVPTASETFTAATQPAGSGVQSGGASATLQPPVTIKPTGTKGLRLGNTKTPNGTKKP